LAEYYAFERTKERFYIRSAYAESGIGAQTLPVTTALATSFLVLANQPEKTRGLAGLTNRATFSKIAILGLGTYWLTGFIIMAKFGDISRKRMLTQEFKKAHY
jgi:hypothetical protein